MNNFYFARRRACLRTWLIALIAAIFLAWAYVAHADEPILSAPDDNLSWLPLAAWVAVGMVALGSLLMVAWLSDIDSQIVIHPEADPQPDTTTVPTVPKS